jgi:hypothetical protein
MGLSRLRFPASRRRKEDADILFILTTNRPEALEAALTSRPGRIDQAIEFPLPDPEGRERLIRLYAQGVEVPAEVVATIVKRTERVSAAFIKELMRRSVQFHLERTDARCIALEDVESALEEMLFSGGSLNVKLLGADVDVGGRRRRRENDVMLWKGRGVAGQVGRGRGRTDRHDVTEGRSRSASCRRSLPPSRVKCCAANIFQARSTRSSVRGGLTPRCRPVPPPCSWATWH